MLRKIVTRNRIGSALRTFALALVLTGAMAPGTLADHMGNHMRPLADITDDATREPNHGCGAENSNAPSDAESSKPATPHYRSGRPW